MSVRVQVILEEAERDELRRLAREEGKSLSAWLRDAGRERAENRRTESRFRSARELRDFFAECDEAAPEGTEPDWEEHLEVIDASRAEGVGRVAS